MYIYINLVENHIIYHYTCSKVVIGLFLYVIKGSLNFIAFLILLHFVVDVVVVVVDAE